LDTSIPIINGVLACNTVEQLRERCNSVGESLANALVEMTRQ